MASRKVAAAAKASTALVPVVPAPAPVVLNAGKLYEPDNPHSWLRLVGDPPGSAGLRIMHGTLRLALHEHRNSAEAFARAKLVPAPSADPLAVTALRHDVIVPEGVDDGYADPWLLPRFIDHALARETNEAAPMLCYVTITDPGVQHLHEQWCAGRRMVEALVDRFCVPMLLIQHDPARARSANPPHLHVLAGVWQLGPRGFGATVTALTNDRTRQIFVDAWREHCAG